MSTDVSTLLVESWTVYVLAIGLIVSRIVFRLITLGSYAKLQPDDWLMVFIIVPFTGLIVSTNQSYSSWNAERGLKFRFAVEEFQIGVLWLDKACLLVLYRRIFPGVLNRRQRQFLEWTSIYCILTYLIIQVVLPLWCLPIDSYFDPSSDNPQCTTYHNHNLLTLALDLTTSLPIFTCLIPFIPTPRKLLLAVLFVLGLIVIVTGIIARCHILVSPKSPDYLIWYTAQAATAIIFANLPFLSSLVATKTNARRRRISSMISLSHWPRNRDGSYDIKEVVSSHRFERVGSIATTVRTPPISRHNSSAGRETDVDDAWSEAESQITTPPTPVRTLRATDPPLELEMFWSNKSTQPLGKDMDLEKSLLERGSYSP